MNSYALLVRAANTSGPAVDRLEALGARPASVPHTWRLMTQNADDAVAAALLAARFPGMLASIGAAHGTDGTSERFARDLATGALVSLETHPARFPVGVAGESSEAAVDAEAALRLVARIVAHRSEAEWRVVDLLTPGVRGQHKAVAEALGISTQAVSKALARTGWQEELLGRGLAARLLRDAAGGPR
ncbi:MULTISPECIES: hypothetical protein [Arthrobacter]|uniref:MarR family transcriptional regulator n=2 Tax=Arthrobacter TaxID=1663 RepID=A0ABU9KIQ6_9MICC|nr:hypothetical protein [Arthrobacter sp. YJM1]MDP5226981.1 hypothetical protein [Arthrobacter sp. YJM1]